MSPVRTPLRTLRQAAAAVCSAALVITAMGSVTPAQAAVTATVMVTTQTAMAASGTIPVTVDVVCPTADYGVGPINVDISMGTAAAYGQLSIPGFEANSTAGRSTNPYHWTSTYTLNAPSAATLAGATTMNITTVVTGRPCVNDATGITDVKTLTVASAPATPKITATTAGNRQASVTYSTVADPANAPVLRYEYRVNGGAAVATGAANPFTITGLTNERASTISVRAVNATGAGAWSSNASVTPVGAPGAPTRLQTLGYDKDIAIKFTAPSKTVNAIDKYEYSTDAGSTWFTTGSTAVITDIKAQSSDGVTPLVNGAVYPIQVRAHNSLGYSPATATVNASPIGAPGAPANIAVTPAVGSVAISFDPFGSPLTANQSIQRSAAIATASSDGGSAITDYQYSTDNGVTFVSAGSATLPLTITNTSDTNTPLVDGTVYIVYIRAINALGTGALSRPIVIVPGGVPGKPVVLATIPANGTVTFAAQVDNAGPAITAAECQIDGGATTAATVVGSDVMVTSWTVNGLTNGATHSFTCRVENAAGWSDLSDAITAAASDVPSAPVLNRVVPGDASLNVEFTPGATNGSDVVSYSVYQNGLLYSDATGNTSFTASPITMTGLINGDVQTVTVTATNAAGESVQSNAVDGTVGQTLVDVAAPSQTVTYGSVISTITPVTTPATSTTDWTVAPTCAVYAPTDTTFTRPLTGRQRHGSYTMHCTGGVATKYYAYTYTDGILTIDPATVVITASSSSVTYGTTAPGITYVVTPPDAGTTINQAPTCSIFAPADTTYSTPLSGVLDAGTYVTRCSGAALNTDYIPKYVKGTFTVTKAKTVSTITCPATSVTYTGGEQTPCSVTITGEDGLNVSVSPSYANNVRAGAATVTYTYAGDTNHNTSTATPASFTIVPAAAYVTVTCPASVVYSGAAANPCYATVTGIGALNLLVGLQTSDYTNNVNAGTAMASYTFAGDSDHGTASGSSTFTITKLPMTITASSANVTYNASVPAITYSTSPAILGSDVASAPTCSTYATSDTAFANALNGVQNAGSYATHCTGGVFSANIAPSYADGSLVIAKAASTSAISCTPTSVVYNGSAQTPCSVAITGAGGLNVSTAPTYTNNTNVGTATASYSYPGDVNHNASTAAAVTFIITKASAAITVTCPATAAYTATAQTPCSWTFTGPGLSTTDKVLTYTNNTNLGTATASYTYAGDANINGASGSAIFTIVKANPTVSLTCPPSVAYTAAAQTPCSVTVTAPGLSTSGTPTYTSNTNVGTATASYAYAGSANVNSGTGSTTFAITKATSTITASSPTAITYGTNIPAITSTSSVSGLTWSPAIMCAVYATTDTTFLTALTGAQNAGSYVTHCANGVNANYAPVYVNGTLTITKSATTNSVTASTPGAITYGAALPNVVATSPAGGWTTMPTCGVYTSSTATTALTGIQNAGSYVTKCSGGVAANYSNITYVIGSFTINRAAVTVTASSPTAITYGTTVSAVSYTTNLATAAFTTNPTCGVYTSAAAGTAVTGVQNAAAYVTKCSGAANANYTIAYANGSFTINKATVTITAQTLTGTRGATFATPTYTSNPTAAAYTTAPTCRVYNNTDTAFATPLSGTIPNAAATYVTRCTGAVSTNYAPSYVNGRLTVA